MSLFNQVVVKAADGKQTVEQHLKSSKTHVKSFTLYVVGEGIEKKVTTSPPKSQRKSLPPRALDVPGGACGPAFADRLNAHPVPDHKSPHGVPPHARLQAHPAQAFR